MLRSRPARVVLAILAATAAGCHGAGGTHGAPGAQPLFADVTQRAGIRFVHQNSATPQKHLIEAMGAGCAWIDYNGDGRPDLLLLNGAPLPGGSVTGRPTLALYRNNGDGTFTDVTHETGLDREVMYAMGVAVGDYDNDGREDFYVSCALGGGHLFHNTGKGFEDVTAAAGVADAGQWGTSCAWLDYDRDGRLDLFVCNYVRYPSLKSEMVCTAGTDRHAVYCDVDAFGMSTNRLYHNDGSGHFTDVTVKSHIGDRPGKALGVAICDVDGDGWPDILVANDTTPNSLFHNERNGTFREVGGASGTAYDMGGGTMAGMGIDADYVLGDGRLAVAISNWYAKQTAFFTEVAPQAFRDDRTVAGIGPATEHVLGFGLCFFDYDNDGLPDMIQVNGHVDDDIETREPGTPYREPTLLLHNLGGGRFADASGDGGEAFSRRILGRGVAWCDYDNDGRVDAVISSNGGPPILLHNEVRNQNHWLTLKLIGTRSNRDGIGAVVTVKAGGRQQKTMVRSGSSYLSASDLRPHFGLGQATSAAVHVDWPSGTRDDLKAVPANGVTVIVEGKGTASG